MEKKKCFVICPIGSSGSEIRRRADQLLRHVIEEVAGDEFQIERADKISKPGEINQQIIQSIIDADLIIVDLEALNPNVMYELGMAHSLNKPTIQLYHREDRLPFDISTIRSIPVDITDLDSVADCKYMMTNMIKEIIENPEDIKSPFQITQDLIKLQNSGVNSDKVLSDILNAVYSLKSIVTQNREEINLQNRIEQRNLRYRIEQRNIEENNQFEPMSYLDYFEYNPQYDTRLSDDDRYKIDQIIEMGYDKTRLYSRLKNVKVPHVTIQILFKELNSQIQSKDE